MRPFVLDWYCIQGQFVPEFCFGFPDAFCRTILSYYGCQVGEACNLAATYGVKDSGVRAVVVEERDCISLVAVLYPVHNQEESGPVMMYYFLGLLPYLGEIAYVRVGGCR